MTKIYGHFTHELPEEEYLMTTFPPSSYYFQKYLKKNKIYAEFITEYFQTFLYSKQKEAGNQINSIDMNNLKGAIKYVANELIENALKFQDGTLPFTAKFSLCSDKHFIFYVTNSINAQQAELFQMFIKHLINEDHEKLYLQAMMANARDKHNTSSRLGLLSMMCIYSAQLGWKFETVQTKPAIMTVNTMVCLNADEMKSKPKKC